MTDDIVARLRGRIGPTVLLSYPPQSTRDPLCCEAADEIERLRAELAAEREECLEQARLNGMGAERELKLMAERDALLQHLSVWRELLVTVRNYLYFMPSKNDAMLARIDAALKGDGDE